MWGTATKKTISKVKDDEKEAKDARSEIHRKSREEK